MTSAAALQKFKKIRQDIQTSKMTSQNCGDKYSSELSAFRQLVWMDWTDLNLQANQNTRRINTSPGIFSIDFRPIFWECSEFLLMKRKFCWLSTSKPNWVIIVSSTSSCPFHYCLLLFQIDILSSARWKYFDFDSYGLIHPILDSQSRTALTMDAKWVPFT